MASKKDRIELKRCPNCRHSGDGELCRKSVMHEWTEGVERERHYKARIDVIACVSCGAEVIDEYARLQQHEVWCRENDLLSPRAIRDLRRRLGLRRERFAELLGLGPASVGRWERGVLVQNKAYDNLMRLLENRANVDELSRRSGIAVRGPLGNDGVRYVGPDGSRGDWRFTPSRYSTESDRLRAREQERRFPLTVQIA